MKIIFAGTPEFASESLNALLAASHNIIAVYTQPDRPKGRGRSLHFSAVKTLAIKHHLPLYQPLSLKDPNEQTILHNLMPDLLVVAAYGLIVPPSILKISRYGCINIHASLLPRWRGAAPIQHAILAGDHITGITIMQMDEGLDTGDLLLKYPCPISKAETSQSLQNKLTLLGAKAIIETLEQLKAGTLKPEKQNPNEATLAPKIFKADAKINWQNSALNLDRQIRAFTPSPVAFSQIQDHTIRIWSAKPLVASMVNATPGTIIKTDQESIQVATKHGILKLLTIQLPGGKPLPIRDILNAKRPLFQAGNRFD